MLLRRLVHFPLKANLSREIDAGTWKIQVRWNGYHDWEALLFIIWLTWFIKEMVISEMVQMTDESNIN